MSRGINVAIGSDEDPDFRSENKANGVRDISTQITTCARGCEKWSCSYAEDECVKQIGRYYLWEGKEEVHRRISKDQFVIVIGEAPAAMHKRRWAVSGIVQPLGEGCSQSFYEGIVGLSERADFGEAILQDRGGCDETSFGEVKDILRAAEERYASIHK
jgi:hypothetical protein